MANNQWDDEKVEKLLHSVPKIKDERSSTDILERLKQDERLKQTRRPKMKRWIPSIVAVAALLVLSLLVPSMIKQTNTSHEIGSESLQTNDDFSAKRSMDTDAEVEESSIIESNDAVEPAAFSIRAMMESHVLLLEEAHDALLLPIGLVHEANVVPVTFILSSDEADENQSDSVALYNKYAAEIDEVGYGFDEYHPYKGKISVSDNTVIHQLPKDHQYDMSTATISVYMNSMKATFTDQERFKVVDTEDKPLAFDYVGEEMADSLEIRLPYFKYTMPSGKVYLVPYENGDSSTVTEALLAMKHAENDIVEEVVPEGVDYKVKVSDEIAILTFDESVDLNALPQNEALEMIEGFMLTANNYGLQIQLNNTEQEHYNKYDLTKPLPKIAGANPIWLP